MHLIFPLWDHQYTTVTWKSTICNVKTCVPFPNVSPDNDFMYILIIRPWIGNWFECKCKYHLNLSFLNLESLGDHRNFFSSLNWELVWMQMQRPVKPFILKLWIIISSTTRVFLHSSLLHKSGIHYNNQASNVHYIFPQPSSLEYIPFSREERSPPLSLHIHLSDSKIEVSGYLFITNKIRLSPAHTDQAIFRSTWGPNHLLQQRFASQLDATG